MALQHEKLQRVYSNEKADVCMYACVILELSVILADKFNYIHNQAN